MRICNFYSLLVLLLIEIAVSSARGFPNQEDQRRIHLLFDSEVPQKLRTHILSHSKRVLSLDVVPDELEVSGDKTARRSLVCSVIIGEEDSGADEALVWKSAWRCSVVLTPLRDGSALDAPSKVFIQRIEREVIRGTGGLLAMPPCPMWTCALSKHSTQEELDKKGRGLCPPCMVEIAKHAKMMNVKRCKLDEMGGILLEYPDSGEAAIPKRASGDRPE